MKESCEPHITARTDLHFLSLSNQSLDAPCPLYTIDDILNRPEQSLLLTAVAAPLLARLLVMECDLSLMFGGLLLQLPSVLLLAAFMLWSAGIIPVRQLPDPPWYAPLVVRRLRVRAR